MANSGFGPGMFGSAAGALAVALLAPAAHAQQGAAQEYDLPAQPLGESLRAVAVASGRGVLAPTTVVEGKRAPALQGRYSADEAIAFLLRGSGLRARLIGANIVIGREDQSIPKTREALDDSDATTIVVTGTRIRGAPIASTVISLGEEEIRNSGQATVAEAVRAIPQNFGGGQNPGIGINVPAAGGIDVSGGSSINLRGLGSDATLTLLNGHRLSYSASRQSVDVSSIPLAAVDHIEVVPDGASALYGSDAVAGVANIVLKRDYRGLETSARIAGSTDGGNFQQLYGALGGKTWNGGGVIVAYEYGHVSAIEARQRSYARQRSPGLRLFPEQGHHSATISGHQDLTSTLSFSIDGLYNHRDSELRFPLNPAGNLAVSRAERPSKSESFVVAPALMLHTGSGWRFTFSGSYGHDRVRYETDTYDGETLIDDSGGVFRNRTTSVEFAGDGSLFALPGGSAKLALGTGYRRDDFELFAAAGSASNIRQHQGSYYGYGELNLPLLSAEQGLDLVDRVNLSAAVRYERYPDTGSVATPKVGLIYAPTPDFEIKGSWGRSFRAPTLNQRYQTRGVSVRAATSFGGSGYPADASILLEGGGNPELRPERATNWAATLDIHPRSLDGASVEITYFHTRYTDRVVTPITYLAQSLSNPIYNDLVVRNPSDAQITEAADADIFINGLGSPYDPSNVVAIVSNRSVNAGRQTIQGVDLLASYLTMPTPDNRIGLTLNASYLKSSQQLTVSQPVAQLAGLIFNPPQFRARGGVSWRHRRLTATGYVNYRGDLTDTRYAVPTQVDGMATVDLALRYATGSSSHWWGGIDLSLSTRNVFNAKPDVIATTVFYDTPYDSTNYTPLGRVISVGISKKW